MRTVLAIVAVVAALRPVPVVAQDLPLPPNTRLVAEDSEAFGSVRLPKGPFLDGSVALTDYEGRVSRQVWRTGRGGRTTLQLLAPIRTRLTAEGYEILHECRDRDCGGFDFRYALDLLPEPDMHVDLGDYRYLLAEQDGPGGGTVLSLVVSRTSEDGYVHVTRVTSAETEAPDVVAVETATEEALAPAPAGSIADRLQRDGRVVLEGLTFATGSSALSDADYRGLAELAEFLKRTPGAVVALVGHTDAVGSLDQNVRLSQRRAASVRAELISGHGVAPGQLVAEGAGYLAPRASNLTEDGRAANRRVEAVLLTTE